MRAKGYKCNNVKCERCVGNSMCGELGDIALNCIDRIIARQTNAQKIRGMSDEELAEMLWKTGRNYRSVCADPVADYNEQRDNLIDWLQQPAE